MVPLQYAMCLFRTAEMKLQGARQSFSNHIHSHSRERFNMMLEEEPRDNFELSKEVEMQETVYAELTADKECYWRRRHCAR